MSMKKSVDQMLVEEEQKEQDGRAFQEEINRLYEAFVLAHHHVNEALNELLNKQLEKNAGYIDIECYIKIMYLKGYYYEDHDNRNAARYCAMRILWMKECYEKPRKKKPRYLDMHPYTFSEEVISFMNKYTSFLKDTYRSIRQKLQLITAFLFLLAFIALTFLAKVPALISCIEALFLTMLNYIVQTRRMPDLFQKNQTNAIEKYVEPSLLGFDRSYRIL